jgi:predicted transcriptional regulator
MTNYENDPEGEEVIVCLTCGIELKKLKKHG